MINASVFGARNSFIVALAIHRCLLERIVSMSSLPSGPSLEHVDITWDIITHQRNPPILGSHVLIKSFLCGTLKALSDVAWLERVHGHSNTLRPKRNDPNFVNDIFKHIF